jgi:hypothetical protein
MKHEFSKAALAKAERLARKNGHLAVAALIGARPPEPEEKLFDAARRGDEATIRKLLEAEAPGPKIGDRMPDGTIYAGISPDSGKAIYAAAADGALIMTFEKAAMYAKDMDAHGHKDWRVPTKGELNVLFNNRTAIGGFNVTGSGPAGWYWSSSRNLSNDAWAQRFSDGTQYTSLRHDNSSLRLVR